MNELVAFEHTNLCLCHLNTIFHLVLAHQRFKEAREPPSKRCTTTAPWIRIPYRFSWGLPAILGAQISCVNGCPFSREVRLTGAEATALNTGRVLRRSPSPFQREREALRKSHEATKQNGTSFLNTAFMQSGYEGVKNGNWWEPGEQIARLHSALESIWGLRFKTEAK